MKSKNRKQNSYMVAVQVAIKPTVYFEVVANNAKDAVAQVTADLVGLDSKRLTKLFQAECLTELDDAPKLKIENCGKSDQYHSEAECLICRRLARANKK